MARKYILVLMNENHFLTHKFGDLAMQMESRIQWFSLTPRIPTEQVIEVRRLNVERYEGWAGITFLERSNNRGFSLSKQTLREINYGDEK